MKLVHNDGGRAAAGMRPAKRGCVARAVAIAAAANWPDDNQGTVYTRVWGRLSRETGEQRRSPRDRSKRPSTADHGVNTNRLWFKRYMAELGFEWVPTMRIGHGTEVHLRDGELPPGRLVVNCSRHLVAVIDGAIHDTYDPSRGGNRCVYGYWIWRGKPVPTGESQTGTGS